MSWRGAACEPCRAGRPGAPAAGLVALLAVLGLLAAACSGPPPVTSTTSSTSTTTTSTTVKTVVTTTRPLPTAYNVGRTTFTWVDSAAGVYTINGADPSAPIPGRVLETEILYPTLNGSAAKENPGAVPATAGGPFPVIAFAHGFDVSPNYYSALLDSWVRAGFIVVAPYFPDQKTATISEVGPETQAGYNDELDMVYEPGDIAFVLQKFIEAESEGLGPLVPGMSRNGDIAVAGQSDGGNVVGALVFGSAYAAARLSLPYHIGAVAILSGAALPYGPSPSYNPYSLPKDNSEYASTSSPPLLQIQSSSDTCNWPYDAAQLFDNLTADPVHLFETLTHASHLEPYTDFRRGNPYQRIVEAVTTEFFELELGWHSSGLSLASVERAASVPGYSSVSTTAPSFPFPPPRSECDLPTPLASKVAHKDSAASG